MNEFENWTKRNSLRYSHCLDDQTKMAVFRSAVANNMVAFELIVKTYCLNYEGNSHFVELVRQFVQQKKYKEVVYLFRFHFCNFYVYPRVISHSPDILNVYFS